MAKLKQALPTLVGQTQTAQRNVHPVRMPDPYEGLADSLGNMFKGGMQLGGAIGSIMEERNELDYRRTFNDAVAEVDARLQKEVYEKTGLGAEGATERTSAIYGEVFGKYSGKLSGRNKQRFEEAWGSRRNAQMPAMMQFEYKNLTGAQLELNKTTITGSVAHFASTGAGSDMNPALEAFDSSYRIQNGGRIINRVDLAAFEKDINDGDGFVQLLDGRKLRVVDEVSDGDKDVITKAEVGRIHDKMKLMSAHYESARQQLLDTANGAIINQYLQAGDYDAAKAYLAKPTLQMSESARAVLTDTVARRSAAYDDYNSVQQSVSSLEAVGGKYGSAEQDKNFNTALKAIQDDKSIPPERKLRKKRMLTEQYKVLQEKQKLQLSQDTTAHIETISTKGFTPVQIAEYIAKVGDPRMRNALQKAFERSLKSPTSAEVKQKMGDIAGGVADGRVIEIDDVRYDTSNPRDIRALCYTVGLPEGKKAELLKALTDVPVKLAANTCADLMGIPTDDEDRGSKALRRYPTLINDLMWLGVNSKKTSPEDLKAIIARLLRSQIVNNYNSAWFDTSDNLTDYLDNDTGNDELYFTYSQMRDALVTFTRIRSNPEAKASDFSPQDVKNFAKARGLRAYRDNDDRTVWYLQPGE